MKSPRIFTKTNSFFKTLLLLTACLVASVNAQQLIDGSRLSAGSLDPTFKNLQNFPIGVDSDGGELSARFVATTPDIRAATIQPDGKILIGGDFQIQQRGVRYRDEFGVTVIWRNLARLNADGTLDVTFMSESVVNLIQQGTYDNSPTSRPLIWGPDGPVHTISAELNEDSYQYIIGGDFLNFSHNSVGASAPRLRYLVLDALTTDPAGRFAEPRIQLAQERASVNGFDATVRKIRRISGGGIVPLISVPDAEARLALTLVQAPVGSIVLQTNPPLGPPTYHRRIGPGSEEADWITLTGEVVPPTYYIMGDFIRVFDNETQPYIVRATRSGTLDTEADWQFAPGPNGRVNDIAVSENENIIIGEFTEVGGTPFNRIAKIDDTGVVDVAFNAGTGFDANAHGIALDPLLLNVVVVGDFEDYNGNTIGRICRLDLNGNFDATFPAPNYTNDDGANGPIRTIVRQPDGRLLIAGSFTSYNGIPRSGIARLERDGSLDESFTPKGVASGINAFATDIEGGPGSASLFNRPVVVGNFSTLYGTGFKGVGRLLGGSFPGIWYQPWEIDAPHIALAGDTITLNVVASDNRIAYPGYPVPAMPFSPSQASSEPLQYQWQLNGRDIPGANQSSLELSVLKYTQAGQYRVRIYNSMYYIYSQTTQVTVLNPYVGIIPAAGLRVQGRIDANDGLNSGLGGIISMTISRMGTATGTITMISGGRSVVTRFAGQFDGGGTLDVTIPRRNLAPLVLHLEMDISGAPTDFSFVNGASTISDGINTAVISAWNKRWSTTTLASAFAGKYNVGLATDAGDLADTIVAGPITRAKTSQGHGYFSMNVIASTGTARITGVLADGTRFNTSSTLWGDTPATMPIWVPLYRSRGSLQGELSVSPLAGNPVTADLSWTKPSGVARSTDSFGFDDVLLTAFVGSGRYSEADFNAALPPGPGNFNLTFDDGLWTTLNGGLSAPPLSQAFTVGTSFVSPVLPNPQKVTTSLNRSSGLVTGSFTDVDVMGNSRTVRYQSLILTQGGSPILRGCYIMPNTARYTSFYIGGSVEGF